MCKELYEFQIAIWISGNDNPTSMFERGFWREQARSQTQRQAEEVASCLAIRWTKGVRIAKRQGDMFVPTKFIPESAANIEEQERIGRMVLQGARKNVARLVEQKQKDQKS